MSVQKRSNNEIKAYFQEQGCKLLDNYINSITKMRYICKCGKESVISWNHFYNGKRCGYCKGGRKKKYTLEEVKKIFIDKQCQLLSQKYKDNKTYLEYICKCGNHAKIFLFSFLKGQFCMKCAAKNRTGENNPRWIHDRIKKDKDNLFRRRCMDYIHRVISKINTNKEHKIIKVLGYSPFQFKEYLQHSFPNLIIKNNTIDHIFPIQAFIDKKLKVFPLVNSLDNLQLININGNCRKSYKYNEKKFINWLNRKKKMESFNEWLKENQDLNESAEATKYSVEINYRSTIDEIAEASAKIILGYVSAGLKQHNFHVKHVYTEKPLRVLVSSRNWDDGEWVGLISWNPEHKCFIISKGFYNKDRKTISIQSSEKCQGENAAEITKHVYNMMHGLKGKPDRHTEKLKPAPLKRGPKS